MSRHLELVPDNNMVHTAHVFDRAAILKDVAVTEQQRNAAARLLTRKAPDLLAMVLGGAA